MARRPKNLDPTASAAALLGSKVRKHREAKGWTQDQLGPKVWVTGDQISKIEIAKRTPSREAVIEFDRLFGTGEYFQDLWHLANKETLPEWFRPYADLEPEATSLRISAWASSMVCFKPRTTPASWWAPVKTLKLGSSSSKPE